MLKAQKMKIFLSILIVLLVLIPVSIYIFIEDYRRESSYMEEPELEDGGVRGVDISTVPFIQSLAPIRAKSGEEYVYYPYYFDRDTEFSELTLSLLSAPSWLSLSEGVVRGMVPEVVVGSTFKFVIEVSDGYNSTTQVNYIVIE